MNDLRALVAETLEVETIGDADELASFENWDSLTVLSLLAMLDARFGINLTARELNQLKTFGELAALIDARAARRDG